MQVIPGQLQEALAAVQEGSRYGAGTRLTESLRALLASGQVQPGEPLATEMQLCRSTGLSRATVRRALRPLAREGLIITRPGRGTYVGHLVGQSVSQGRLTRRKTVRTGLRMAVLADRTGEWESDWYSQGVFAGLQAAGAELDLSVERLAYTGMTSRALVEHLERTRPQVLVLLTPTPADGPLVGAAQHMGIRCVGAGSWAVELGLPTVTDDDAHAMGLAMDHLLAQGHQRVALGQTTCGNPYTFRARSGYLTALQRHGLEPDQNLELWLDYRPEREDAQFPQRLALAIAHFLTRQRPTAIVLTEGRLAAGLGRLVRQGALRIPDDLSLICWGQLYDHYAHWLGGLRPTIIHLPTEALGVRLAQLAADLARGQEVPPLTLLHDQLIPGDTVRPSYAAAQTAAR